MVSARLSRAGLLIDDPQYERIGTVGQPYMHLEVAIDPGGHHGVLSMLAGRDERTGDVNMAACGFQPDLLRELARLLLRAADEIERRHGRGESGLVVPT